MLCSFGSKGLENCWIGSAGPFMTMLPRKI
jgi:hypothetical protein